ncbi:hypothetical protein NOF04DRAFT_4227 [Fusarium oxysporum II5]|uniref:Uncharacterized protein n=2 Tax=Fusarium oxysporum species complex TaxID=171631 RepID=X0JYV6_FUSO5|nr:uncharacterized protein FOIG_16684 [Fusarium odoratissimum NRRL 54006]EXL90039.1 hypothetical protein FOIG_16684 [Fusarium odoratissimum NRRL 54006]KAK2123365.1 hypothetical protein NOF04DRAFT_4227 [Fusarium oxysporum II5]TXB95747.1 hypothetical protein FocTR4_00015786 [Fusarium oxysporum f. sp. cubense]
MRFNLVVPFACMSLAAAMPAKHEPVDERALDNILGDLEAQDETLETLVKRIDAKIYRDDIPDCNKEDPSFMIPKQTGYGVDQGVNLPKSGKDDACTTGHNDDHYWTGYCNGIDYKILDGALEFAIPNTEAKVSLGSSINYQYTDVDGTTTMICTTDSTTNTCQWEDQNCHQVWFADRTKRIWGHMDRVCVGKTDVEAQQQTLNSNGRYVRGQAEFSIAIPVNHIVGCNAKCSDLTYSEPIPSDGTVRVPFDITFD